MRRGCRKLGVTWGWESTAIHDLDMKTGPFRTHRTRGYMRNDPAPPNCLLLVALARRARGGGVAILLGGNQVALTLKVGIPLVIE